jgi:hypothetical protein
MAKALYVSEFGSKLDPVLKDGMGRISKVALNGKIWSRSSSLRREARPSTSPRASGSGRLAVGHRHRRGVDLRPEDEEGPQGRLPGIQFANDDRCRQRALRERQP